MDTGFSTPLLDSFRRDEVPREVRLLAARGELAPRAHEQLALLMVLTEDGDAEVAAIAGATLAAIPAESLAQFLARSDVSDSTRAFFAARGVRPAASPSSDDQPLVSVADDVQAEEPEEGEEETLPVVQRLAAMTVAQRVVRAMKGTREERAILIRDSSKLVSVSVLSSPKLTDTEVERIARMTNVSEEVLRIIGRTRAWMKSYAVMAALARNPKSPVALALNLLPRLTDRDLKVISTDHNVADVVRTTARRKVVGS
jgi:hypothetical protein